MNHEGSAVRSRLRRLAPFALLAFVVCTGLFLYFRSCEPSAIPAAGGLFIPERRVLNVTPYSQMDPRWRDNRIGTTSETVGAVGCTLCCLSMAFDCFGLEMQPDVLNSVLSEQGGYTDRGWITWKTVDAIGKGRIKVRVPRAPTFALIDEALQEGNPVIAKTRIHGGVIHWVLIVGKDGLEYIVADPLGRTAELKKLSDVGDGIYAIRITAKVQDASAPNSSN